MILKQNPLIEARAKMANDSAEALAAAARPEMANSTSQAERNEKLQQELMEIQMKYQREIEVLEKEVKELKKQLLLRMEKADAGKRRKMKVGCASLSHLSLFVPFRSHLSTCTRKCLMNCPVMTARTMCRFVSMHFITAQNLSPGQSATRCCRWRPVVGQD